MCISQILEYLVFIQNTETGVLLGKACIKYRYKCIENIYIAERIKENMGTICMKNNGKLMISFGFHYKYHKLYHFFTAHEKN